MLRQSERNGRYYGTANVLLSRFVDGVSEELVGTRAPFGSVLVEEFEGRRYIEEPDSFWTSKGFIITDSPLLDVARQTHRKGNNNERTW